MEDLNLRPSKTKHIESSPTLRQHIADSNRIDSALAWNLLDANRYYLNFRESFGRTKPKVRGTSAIFFCSCRSKKNVSERQSHDCSNGLFRPRPKKILSWTAFGRQISCVKWKLLVTWLGRDMTTWPYDESRILLDAISISVYFFDDIKLNVKLQPWNELSKNTLGIADGIDVWIWDTCVLVGWLSRYCAYAKRSSPTLYKSNQEPKGIHAHHVDSPSASGPVFTRLEAHFSKASKFRAYMSTLFAGRILALPASTSCCSWSGSSIAPEVADWISSSWSEDELEQRSKLGGCAISSDIFVSNQF